MTALIARHHRGALPNETTLADLPYERRQIARVMAGILRLVEAIDISHRGQVKRLRVSRTPETIVIHADGYSPDHPRAEEVAAARHLLESALGLPILVRGDANPGERRLASSKEEPGRTN